MKLALRQWGVSSSIPCGRPPQSRRARSAPILPASIRILPSHRRRAGWRQVRGLAGRDRQQLPPPPAATAAAGEDLLRMPQVRRLRGRRPLRDGRERRGLPPLLRPDDRCAPVHLAVGWMAVYLGNREVIDRSIHCFEFDACYLCLFDLFGPIVRR